MGLMGEKMLLHSVDGLHRITAVYLIIILALLTCEPSIASDNKGGDIVTKSKKDDLITAPVRGKKKSAGDKVSSTAGKIKSGVAGSSQRFPSATTSDPLHPDSDYLDIYIGKCPFTEEAIKGAKRFSAQHPKYVTRYYGMKTQSDFTPNVETLKDIEIYMPIKAKEYNITAVPTFILNRKGIIYKIAGDTDLNEIYEAIEKGTLVGVKKGNYIDLEEKGNFCKAVAPDLRPVKLTALERKQIEAENSPPNMAAATARLKIDLPEGKPVSMVREISPYLGATSFVVFSKKHKAWASELIKRGAFGCCTDCDTLASFWPKIQFCTQDLLKSMDIVSVPAHIIFKQRSELKSETN